MASWIILRSMGSKPYAGIPSLEHKSPASTQITSNCEKRQGCSLPGTDGWRHKELFKRPMHKFPFAATYPGLWQRAGAQSGLDTLEETLGMEVLGERTERVATRILVLSHPPYCSSHLAQADHSPPSGRCGFVSWAVWFCSGSTCTTAYKMWWVE